MRTMTVQEAEEQARAERSEAWLALLRELLLADTEAEALEAGSSVASPEAA